MDELEPNPRGAAQPLGGFSTHTWTTLRGTLAPGDEDHFSFTVSPGQGPNIVFFLHTTPGVLEGCGALDAQLTLLNATGGTTGFRANNVPGSTACPHVAYNSRNDVTLRVSAGAAPPPVYYLSIVVPARPSHSGP